MSFEIRRRMFAVAASILTVAATTASLSIVGLATAGPSSADILDDCPNTIPPSTQVDNQIGASYSVSGNTATYSFDSLVNLSPTNGVPGLIEYCVFTGPLPDSSAVAPGLAGADGALWKASGDKSSYFGFIRPDGDPSNIPFDGTTGITMGTATWSGGVPAAQTIVLHINDATVCSALGQSSNTCYVYPGKGNQDLSVIKTATPSFTRTYHWGITKSVDHNGLLDIPQGGSALFNYTVNVTHDGGTDGNWQVTGHITVTNPNPADFNGVNVSDSIDNGGSCTVAPGGPGGTVDPSNATIPASGSVDFPYTCTYTAPPGPSGFTNTGTAAWSQAVYNTPDGSASGTATGDFASVTPAIVDGSVHVTDTLGGDLGTVTYQDASPKALTYPYTFTGDPAGTCTTHHNTATFTTSDTKTTGQASQDAKVCVGADLTALKTATPSFTRTFTWGISKSVDHNGLLDIPQGGPALFNYTVNVTHDGGTDGNWQVAGKITVTNPNDWEAVTANVADAIDNGGNCAITGNTSASIPAGQSVDFPYTCTYAAAPNPSGFTNTGTATWDNTAAHTPGNSALATVTGDFAKVAPAIVDGSVHVTDTLGGDLGTVTYQDASPKALTYPYTFTGDPAGTCTTHHNIATSTTSDTKATGQASQDAKVCVGADLNVIKTAAPSFTRTYNWSIAKQATPTLIEQAGGGTASASYKVTVNQTGFTDGNWKVSGKITVTNPNDWEAVTANVADAIDNGGNCAITGNTSASIPAGQSVDFPYTCTYAAAPNPSGFTNTGTATWDNTAAHTPGNSALATVTGDFANVTPATVHKTITVMDSFAGSLGTVTATDTTPFASSTFTYSRTFTVPANNCVKYPNTATIVETGQSASQSVEVCGPAKTGALTMGFWQNKNGQAIITGGASTSGVCNSGTWLRQYAPFQDLSSTASCSAVATYVSNIIKAANASGSSMNAMLKAQMLATALDVYFSDPLLGGNKISAPAPIGSVTIDLTKICHMIDGSGGTATCSGTYENVSSAFGGATSKTVSQMLSYAASQSNAGGSIWYANVKATQQLAKDAFDAINNQVAFSP